MTPEDFAKRLTPEQFARLEEDLLTRMALTVEAAIKPRVPVLTGTLRRSIASRVEVSQHRAVVGSNLVYARPVNRRRQFMEKGLADAQGDIDRILADSGEAFLAELAQ